MTGALAALGIFAFLLGSDVALLRRRPTGEDVLIATLASVYFGLGWLWATSL